MKCVIPTDYWDEILTGILSRLINHCATSFYSTPAPLLVLSVAPQLVDVQEGSNVSVLCTVDCFCPGAVLEWNTSSGEPLPPNAEVHSY